MERPPDIASFYYWVLCCEDGSVYNQMDEKNQVRGQRIDPNNPGLNSRVRVIMLVPRKDYLPVVAVDIPQDATPAYSARSNCQGSVLKSLEYLCGYRRSGKRYLRVVDAATGAISVEEDGD